MIRELGLIFYICSFHNDIAPKTTLMAYYAKKDDCYVKPLSLHLAN